MKEIITLNNFESVVYNSMDIPEEIKSRVFIHNFKFFDGCRTEAIRKLFQTSSGRNRPVLIKNSEWKRYCCEFKEIVKSETIITSVEKRLEKSSIDRIKKFPFNDFCLIVNSVEGVNDSWNKRIIKSKESDFYCNKNEIKLKKSLSSLNQSLLKFPKGVAAINSQIKKIEKELEFLSKGVLKEDQLIETPKIIQRSYKSILLKTTVGVTGKNCLANDLGYECELVSKNKRRRVQNLNDLRNLNAIIKVEKPKQTIEKGHFRRNKTKGIKKEEGGKSEKRESDYRKLLKKENMGRKGNLYLMVRMRDNEYQNDNLRIEKHRKTLKNDNYFEALNNLENNMIFEKAENMERFSSLKETEGKFKNIKSQKEKEREKTKRANESSVAKKSGLEFNLEESLKEGKNEKDEKDKEASESIINEPEFSKEISEPKNTEILNISELTHVELGLKESIYLDCFKIMNMTHNIRLILRNNETNNYKSEFKEMIKKEISDEEMRISRKEILLKKERNLKKKMEAAELKKERKKAEAERAEIKERQREAKRKLFGFYL